METNPTDNQNQWPSEETVESAPADQNLADPIAADPATDEVAEPRRAQQAEQSEKKKRAFWFPLFGLVTALVLVIGIAFSQGWLTNDKYIGPLYPKSTVTTTEPSAPAQLDECSKPKPVVPVRMIFEPQGWSIPVISLGLDPNTGAAKTPPGDQPNMAGWYNQGMHPGDATGHAVFTIHTYRNGGAMGNNLQDPEKGLKKGDTIKIVGLDGSVLCYQYTHSIKIRPEDYKYNPDDDILYDTKNKHELAIVVCTNYNWDKHVHEERIIFYAELKK